MIEQAFVVVVILKFWRNFNRDGWLSTDFEIFVHKTKSYITAQDKRKKSHSLVSNSTAKQCVGTEQMYSYCGTSISSYSTIISLN